MCFVIGRHFIHLHWMVNQFEIQPLYTTHILRSPFLLESWVIKLFLQLCSTGAVPAPPEPFPLQPALDDRHRRPAGSFGTAVNPRSRFGWSRVLALSRYSFAASSSTLAVVENEPENATTGYFSLLV